MQKVGAAASLCIEQFRSSQLLAFLWSYERAGGKDESWEKAVLLGYILIGQGHINVSTLNPTGYMST